MKICKYELEIEKSNFNIILPKKATILSCQMQKNKPVMWVMADENDPQELKHFEWIKTGEPFNKMVNRKYIETIQLTDYAVGHLFEIVK